MTSTDAGKVRRADGSTIFDLQGHRGARGLWPENSLAGFRAALALGVSSIELDVVLSADGVPMVYHDLHLNPDITRGPDGSWIAKPGPAIATLLASELAAFDIGRIRPRTRHAVRFPDQKPVDGEGIPGLADACRLTLGSAVRLDVEIKAEAGLPDDASRLAALVDAILGVVDATTITNVSFRSFDWRVLRRVRELRPDMPLAWLTATGPNANPAAVAAEVALHGWPEWAPVWAPDHSHLRKWDVASARASGLRVKPWTVNAPRRLRKLVSWGVDGICTDRPDRARTVLAELALALPQLFVVA
jgi:glycerophosphoryl diester phosphodiesterase